MEQSPEASQSVLMAPTMSGEVTNRSHAKRSSSKDCQKRVGANAPSFPRLPSSLPRADAGWRPPAPVAVKRVGRTTLLLFTTVQPSPAQPGPARPHPAHAHWREQTATGAGGGGGGDFCLSFGQRTQTGRQAGERSRGASERASGRAGAVCGEKTENNTVALRRMARRVRAERPFGGFPVCRSDTITKTTEDRLHRSDP